MILNKMLHACILKTLELSMKSDPNNIWISPSEKIDKKTIINSPNMRLIINKLDIVLIYKTHLNFFALVLKEIEVAIIAGINSQTSLNLTAAL